jgi:hypothetical protein
MWLGKALLRVRRGMKFREHLKAFWDQTLYVVNRHAQIRNRRYSSPFSTSPSAGRPSRIFCGIPHSCTQIKLAVLREPTHSGDKSHRSLGGLCRTKDKLSRLVKRVLNNSKNALVIMHSVDLPDYIEEIVCQYANVQKRSGCTNDGV